MKHIDAEYYGYMDDDDGVLIPLERAAETAGTMDTLFNRISQQSFL